MSQSAWRDRLLSVFAIDLRSLAAFRIFLAVLILWDTFWGFSLVGDFYTDSGILPRWARIDLYDTDPGRGHQYWWSLHMMTGEAWGIRLLLAVQAASAFFLLIGYRTRLATIVTFLLVASVQSRNPVILDGGDDLMKCLLFWSIFLPLGAMASVDRRLSRRKEQGSGDEAAAEPKTRERPGSGGASPFPIVPSAIVTIGTAALLMQIAMVYIFSAWLKNGEEWHPNYSATYYAVNLDSFATPLGIWLRDAHGLLNALTFAAFWLEWLAPLLAFCPIKNAWCRMIAILGFWGFHLGTVLTLDIGLFPFMGMCAWTVFLPSEFWNGRIGQKIISLGTFLLGRLERLLPAERRWGEAHGIDRWFQRPEPPRLKLGLFGSIVATAALAYVFLWNLRETDPRFWEPRLLPNSLSWIGRVTHIDQNWGMFAPRPPRHDGWFIMQGVLNDGTKVNLWEPGQPVVEGRPTLPSAKLRGQRWRKYFTNIMREDHRRHRVYFAEFLVRRWDTHYSGDDPRKMVKTVNVVFMEQETPPPGEIAPPPRAVILYRSPE